MVCGFRPGRIAPTPSALLVTGPGTIPATSGLTRVTSLIGIEVYSFCLLM